MITGAVLDCGNFNLTPISPQVSIGLEAFYMLKQAAELSTSKFIGRHSRPME